MSHTKGYLDLYTLNEPLTHKAKFWSWYIRALKGTTDIRADDTKVYRPPRPPVISHVFDDAPSDIRARMAEIEANVFKPSRLSADLPVSPYTEDPANRIRSTGYSYTPLHRSIYGTSRPRVIYNEPGYYNYDRY